MGLHVVTGASAGIGHGVAIALAARGEQVIAVARRNDALAALAESAGGHIDPVTADVATEAGVDAIVAAVGGRPVRGLVHAAATSVAIQPWYEIDADELTEHFRVHVAAPIALTQALLAGERVVERTVIIDSYSASMPREGWAAYSILKAAAQLSFRAAAPELESRSIVVRVFPGAVATPLLRRVLDDTTGAPAAEFYRDIAAQSKVSDPESIGQELAAIVVDMSDTDITAEVAHHIGHSLAVD